MCDRINPPKAVAWFLSGLLSLMLSGCSPEPAQDAHDTRDPHGSHDAQDHHEGEDELTLTPAQVKEAGIQLGSFQSMEIGEAIVANGVIELPPNNIASISVPMEGFVENIRFLEGAQVTKGQVLVTLRHPAYIQLQQDYVQARSRLEYLEQEMTRQETLREAEVNAGKTVQKIRSEVTSTQAEVAGLREKLRFLGISPEQIQAGHFQSSVSLTAPFSGTITKLTAHRGQLASPSQVIMEVINRDHMHLELRVFQRDIPKVKAGQKITFTIPAFEDKAVYEGEVSLVGKSLDLDSKTIRVHGHFTETEVLIPGLYAEAKIYEGAAPRRVLPTKAIIRDGGKQYYFVEANRTGEESVFDKVEVTTGVMTDDFTEVLWAANLTDTTAIVVEGAFSLASEMNKGEGGHSH